MNQFAKYTKVPAERSRAEIEHTLERYGATGFMYGTTAGQAMVMFEAADRRIKFVVDLPEDAQKTRQRWRALLLVIKAKLESVETGIVTFDDAFMPHIVMPDGKTVGEHMRPQIEQAYETGTMPPLLPHYEGGS